jgi:osmotically-inducible protein OsmY
MNMRLDCAVAVVVIAAVVPACNWHSDEPVETVARADIDLPTMPQPDPWITTQLQARYFADPIVRGNDVRVMTADGAVTLRGTVPSRAAKDRAVALARRIGGVTRVDDQLTVEPVPGAVGAPQPAGQPTAAGRSPAGSAWTTTTIQARYFADPDVKGRDIDVSTDAAGAVTLRGRVDSPAAKAAAVRIANETEGVARVIDEVRVSSSAGGGDVLAAPAEGGDAWITANVQSKYFLDADVKRRDIDVETKNGVVTLSGDVQSPAERRQALDLARTTAGVRDVVDRLDLRATTALTGGARSPKTVVRAVTGNAPAPSPPDSWITTTILSKCFLSADVRSEEVQVTTHDGTVTLTGRVRKAAARSAIEAIARGTKGVRSVVNRIQVAAT